MKRVSKELIPWSCLDHGSQIHDPNPIAEMFHHTKVMGDKQIRKPSFLLKPFEQINDLCLNGYIQCGDRFIRNY